MSDTECTWAEDAEAWGTSCGHWFTLNDGTPSHNRMAFCCYCGKPLREVQETKSDPWDWERQS